MQKYCAKTTSLLYVLYVKQRDIKGRLAEKLVFLVVKALSNQTHLARNRDLQNGMADIA